MAEKSYGASHNFFAAQKPGGTRLDFGHWIVIGQSGTAFLHLTILKMAQLYSSFLQ